MSFFNFSDSLTEEKSLVQMYVNIGFKADDVKDALQKCKDDSKREKTDSFPNNFGDYLLENASEGLYTQIDFVKKRIGQGLLEQDIKFWWNLSDLDRRMMKWQDDITRMATYQSLLSQGISSDAAIVVLRKNFPVYGNPFDESKTTGNDRPLYEEIHGRVTELIQKKGIEYLKNNSIKFTSMNAFLRSELKLK